MQQAGSLRVAVQIAADGDEGAAPSFRTGSADRRRTTPWPRASKKVSTPLAHGFQHDIFGSLVSSAPSLQPGKLVQQAVTAQDFIARRGDQSVKLNPDVLHRHFDYVGYRLLAFHITFR